MRRSIVFMCSVALLLSGFAEKALSQVETVSAKDAVKVMYSAELEGLANSFVKVYAEENPTTNVSAVLLEDVLKNGALQDGEIALLNKEQLHMIDPETSRITVVGRQVFVPITNKANPLLAAIKEEGLSPADFAKAYTCDGDGCWAKVLDNGKNLPVHAYRINDPLFVSYLANFMDASPDAIKGHVMTECSEVFSKVKSDKNAIGFCTLSQLQNLQAEGHAMEVAMIPVDLNNNGEMDHFEEIYGDVDNLARGVWIGKYTGALYSRIFAVSSSKASEDVLATLRWMTGDGQDVVLAQSYSGINKNEQDAILAALDNKETVTAVEAGAVNKTSFILLLLGVLMGGGLLTLIVLRILNTKGSRDAMAEGAQFAAANPYDGPAGYLYDQSHTWTYLEKDGKIKVGVDSFLQYVTGGLSKVNMKSVGDQVKKGETVLALIQDGKTMGVKSPVSGTITARNKDLLRDSSMVNGSPYEQGWFYEIEATDWSEDAEGMMAGDKYIDWVKGEFERLKDFVATVIKPQGDVMVAMQSGGEVKEGIMKEFGPEAWEEFQTGFLRNRA